MQKKPNNLKRFVQYYKPYKLIFIIDMTSAFLVAVTGMVYPIISRVLLNDYIPNQNFEAIIITSAIMLLIYLVRYGLRYVIQYWGHIMGIGMQAKMRSDLFKKLEKLPYTFFDNNETGKIMSRMTNDLFDIAELAHHGPENVFISVFSIIASLVYLCTINVWLTLICFTMVPIMFLVSFSCRKKLKEAFAETRVAQASINASVESSVSGIRVTKAYTNEEAELQKFEVSNKEFINARTKSIKALAKFMSTSNFVTDIFDVVMILSGGLFLFYGKIDFADFTAFVLSIKLFINPVSQLINFMEQYHSAASGFKRFSEILDEDEEKETGSAVFSELKGNIVYNHVSMNYGEGLKNILNDICLEIKAGEKVAFVGPTGGGKTTMCHVLPRFYPIQKGSISIDGRNIDEYTLNSLRSNIGIVQQDVFLFGGTIKDNIRYGNPEASDEMVIDAAKRANLYDYIQTLPEGLETEIGERGVKLSGGQKQRVSIARAFLKNPKILILDEATSALDNTTEFLIQQSLDELCKGRTTIVVAHRLSTVKNADKICVISDGIIKEIGSHDDLIKKGGIYKSLYDLQFKDVDGEHLDILNKHILIS